MCDSQQKIKSITKCVLHIFIFVDLIIIHLYVYHYQTADATSPKLAGFASTRDSLIAPLGIETIISAMAKEVFNFNYYCLYYPLFIIILIIHED